MKLLQIALSLLLVLSPIACASLSEVRKDAHRITPADPRVQLIGSFFNIENKSVDFKVRPPGKFKATLMKLETKYNDEWSAFDRHTDCCTLYYGWIRGNVLGEYKMRLCEEHKIDLISLTRHGIGGMAFSRLKDTYETDKKAFFSNERFRLPLRGRDMWGYFTVDTVAEIFGTGEFGEVFGPGKFMVGSWHTNHGSFGKYNGTFYGIRLDTVKKAFASITDQSLYQAMINFESLKQGGTLGMTKTMKEHIGDTGTIEKNTSHVYTTNHSNEYHKLSCPKLGTEDLIEFTSSRQARNAGGVPCKDCKP